MTPVVESCIDHLLPARLEPDVVVSEVPAAIGIVDLLAVTFAPEAVKRRNRLGIGPVCSALRVRVLDGLSCSRWNRVETIARRVGSSAPALTRSTLKPLAELDLIELREGRVRSTGAWSPLAARLTAVELKLDKWRGALRQADNFALSTDRAWVILDHQRIGGVNRHRDRFKEMGVGLAAIDPHGTLSVLTRPRQRQPVRWLRALIAERAWSVIVKEQGQLPHTSARQVSRKPASTR